MDRQYSNRAGSSLFRLNLHLLLFDGLTFFVFSFPFWAFPSLSCFLVAPYLSFDVSLCPTCWSWTSVCGTVRSYFVGYSFSLFLQKMSDERNGYGFQITTPHKTYFLVAADPLERNKWVTGIRYVRRNCSGCNTVIFIFYLSDFRINYSSQLFFYKVNNDGLS